MNDSAKRMANLDFSVPSEVSTGDEFGELSASLNAMAGNLQQAFMRLEERSEEHTSELQSH